MLTRTAARYKTPRKTSWFPDWRVWCRQIYVLKIESNCLSIYILHTFLATKIIPEYVNWGPWSFYGLALLHTGTFDRNYCHFNILPSTKGSKKRNHRWMRNLNLDNWLMLCYLTRFEKKFFLKVAQINYISRNQLHSTANLNFGLHNG